MNNLIKASFSKVKTLHFVGIGGIGMSGIAEMFIQFGYIVQGSDVKENNNIVNLKSKGATFFLGHSSENIKNADVVVVSSAIKEDNIEYKAAIDNNIPVFKRSQMLAELMRFKWSIAVAGTHGKTTTTSLISHIMQHNNMDPTAIIGGVVNSWNNNSFLGNSNWLVAESDESDGSFVDLPASISVVTNIEAEHLDYYKDYDNLKSYFTRFINRIPFYGFSVVCIDSPGVQEVMPTINKRSIISYGFSAQSDYRAVNIRYDNDGVRFDIECKYKNKNQMTYNYYIPTYGDHNVLNAMAAIAVCENIDIKLEVIKEALKSFQGVVRRFSNIGSYKNIIFIDDYAHHPTEISAVIKAANQVTQKNNGKIISIVQPHRYSRVKNHFEEFCRCFNDSNYVWVLDVYKAGEEVLEEYTSENLVKEIKNYGHKSVEYIANIKDLEQKIIEISQKEPISMILFMGAGDITAHAKKILNNLNNIK